MNPNKVAVLIEEESTFLMKFKMIFRKLTLRYNLDTFDTSEDMIKEYTAGKYNVTMIDLNLKGLTMEGLTLAKKITEINDTKIFIISTSDGNRPYTGDTSKTELEVAKEIGIEGWLVKGGVKLVRRLERLFKDIEEKNFGQFKLYND